MSGDADPKYDWKKCKNDLTVSYIANHFADVGHCCDTLREFDLKAIHNR
jgi:hypothetical protein